MPPVRTTRTTFNKLRNNVAHVIVCTKLTMSHYSNWVSAIQSEGMCMIIKLGDLQCPTISSVNLFLIVTYQWHSASSVSVQRQASYFNLLQYISIKFWFSFSGSASYFSLFTIRKLVSSKQLTENVTYCCAVKFTAQSVIADERNASLYSHGRKTWRFVPRWTSHEYLPGMEL